MTPRDNIEAPGLPPTEPRTKLLQLLDPLLLDVIVPLILEVDLGPLLVLPTQHLLIEVDHLLDVGELRHLVKVVVGFVVLLHDNPAVALAFVLDEHALAALVLAVVVKFLREVVELDPRGEAIAASIRDLIPVHPRKPEELHFAVFRRAFLPVLLREGRQAVPVPPDMGLIQLKAKRVNEAIWQLAAAMRVVSTEVPFPLDEFAVEEEFFPGFLVLTEKVFWYVFLHFGKRFIGLARLFINI